MCSVHSRRSKRGQVGKDQTRTPKSGIKEGPCVSFYTPTETTSEASPLSQPNHRLPLSSDRSFNLKRTCFAPSLPQFNGSLILRGSISIDETWRDSHVNERHMAVTRTYGVGQVILSSRRRTGVRRNDNSLIFRKCLWGLPELRKKRSSRFLE